MKHIRIGSVAEITVDAFPDTRFEGIVVAISSATGAKYSPHSHDNAVGNFVKTAQRIPVKIAFTGNNDSEILSQLAAGMNVECNTTKHKVTTKNMRDISIESMQKTPAKFPSGDS
jgi:membrane fusion protein (multidrug efflux system)